MAETALPVEHLFTIVATTGTAQTIANGPYGTRVIVPVIGGTFEGPKLRGTVIGGSGGDYLTLRADGSFKVDVRIVLQTEDGATILMTYTGIGTRSDSGFALRTAPLFETGDERYSWLNRVQAVGVGSSGQGSVTYLVYALQ